MLTIVETPLFKNLVSDYWSEDERGEFCSWLANNPDFGGRYPRLRKLPESPVETSGQWQERWRPCHLLQPTGKRRDMVADYLRQERTGKYPVAHP